MDKQTDKSKSKNKRDSLSKLLREIHIVNDREFERKIGSYKEDFKRYYQDGNYNLYSQTYQWLSDIEDQGALDYLDFRLAQIETLLDEDETCSEKIVEKFIKLRDYTVLEAARATNYNSIKDTEENAKSILNETRNLKDQVLEDRKNSNIQAVTVLSIFTGVAMAFFGGFSMFSGALTSIKDKGDYIHIAIISLIVGFVMFNTIYSLIYAAGRVSGSTLAPKNHENCLECGNGDTCNDKMKLNKWFHKFIRKYPYAFVMNIFLLFLIVIFLLVDVFLLPA
ncbi:MAG: hypothetical protein BI182_08425 [Acetobacterium sp. MES1]|uniref:hypothetical protein n=1 Tax=Acetobacterium sp. MES1 TaxID=1899015 RepID=UPI000B9D16F6|nr:hypothetical protein [Acetobacterium sp. MES1]OXS26409.1 MAG: hypothetical protein BI182_08425 [Acetobacterium sp. MES1]